MYSRRRIGNSVYFLGSFIYFCIFMPAQSNLQRNTNFIKSQSFADWLFCCENSRRENSLLPSATAYYFFLSSKFV